MLCGEFCACRESALKRSLPFHLQFADAALQNIQQGLFAVVILIADYLCLCQLTDNVQGLADGLVERFGCSRWAMPYSR